MFSKKKKSTPVLPNPPVVLKETKTYRFVKRQVKKYTDRGVLTDGYIDQLVLEEKDANAMQEPYWKTTHILYHKKSDYSSSTSAENLLSSIVRELLGIE